MVLSVQNFWPPYDGIESATALEAGMGQMSMRMGRSAIVSMLARVPVFSSARPADTTSFAYEKYLMN
jgi:hypothetical protein